MERFVDLSPKTKTLESHMLLLWSFRRTLDYVSNCDQIYQVCSLISSNVNF